MKVKSMKRRLNLEPGNWRETTIYVNYDSTDKATENYHRKIPEKRFYINLPQVVADSLGREDSRGHTQEEALAAASKQPSGGRPQYRTGP